MFAESDQLLLGPALRGEPERQRLQRGPYLDQIVDVGVAELANRRPGAGPRRGQALGDERLERVSDRHPADTHLGGQIPFDQSRARRADAVDDLVLQLPDDAVGLGGESWHAKMVYHFWVMARRHSLSFVPLLALLTSCAIGSAATDPSGRARVRSPRPGRLQRAEPTAASAPHSPSTRAARHPHEDSETDDAQAGQPPVVAVRRRRRRRRARAGPWPQARTSKPATSGGRPRSSSPPRRSRPRSRCCCWRPGPTRTPRTTCPTRPSSTPEPRATTTSCGPRSGTGRTSRAPTGTTGPP